MREFQDDTGARWIAYPVNSTARSELAGRWLPGPYQGGWLVFESGERKLRLAPIPSGWHDMTDAALRKLLATATPTTPTTPRGMRPYGSAQPQHAQQHAQQQQHADRRDSRG